MRRAEVRMASLGDCGTCGKVRYATRDAARHAGRVTGAKFGCRMRSYECSGYWHLTSVDAAKTTAIRSGDPDWRCDWCGRQMFASKAAAAREAALQDIRGTGQAYAWCCGAAWHVKSFRWSGPYGKGAKARLKRAQREQAEWRNARSRNRSGKGRAKRPRKDSAIEEEAA